MRSSSGSTPDHGRSPLAPPPSSSAGGSPASSPTPSPASTRRPEGACAAIRLRPDVFLVRAPDGSGRLLDLAGSFHVLDLIATELLWDVVSRGRSEAVRTTARLYRVPEQRVAADLGELLKQLPAGIDPVEATRRGEWVDPLVVAALSLLRRVGRPRLRA